jgi:hypothetical protein
MQAVAVGGMMLGTFFVISYCHVFPPNKRHNAVLPVLPVLPVFAGPQQFTALQGGPGRVLPVPAGPQQSG